MKKHFYECRDCRTFIKVHQGEYCAACATLVRQKTMLLSKDEIIKAALAQGDTAYALSLKSRGFDDLSAPLTFPLKSAAMPNPPKPIHTPPANPWPKVEVGQTWRWIDPVVGDHKTYQVISVEEVLAKVGSLSMYLCVDGTVAHRGNWEFVSHASTDDAYPKVKVGQTWRCVASFGKGRALKVARVKQRNVDFEESTTIGMELDASGKTIHQKNWEFVSHAPEKAHAEADLTFKRAMHQEHVLYEDSDSTFVKSPQVVKVEAGQRWKVRRSGEIRTIRKVDLSTQSASFVETHDLVVAALNSEGGMLFPKHWELMPVVRKVEVGQRWKSRQSGEIRTIHQVDHSAHTASFGESSEKPISVPTTSPLFPDVGTRWRRKTDGKDWIVKVTAADAISVAFDAGAQGPMSLMLAQFYVHYDFIGPEIQPRVVVGQTWKVDSQKTHWRVDSISADRTHAIISKGEINTQGFMKLNLSGQPAHEQWQLVHEGSPF